MLCLALKSGNVCFQLSVCFGANVAQIKVVQAGGGAGP
jgi:hypothetical protein